MDLELQCPHCLEYVVINRAELNCCIFRHAAFVGSLVQVNPHASEEVCNQLVASNAVVGCAKPFRVVPQPDGTFVAEACGYI